MNLIVAVLYLTKFCVLAMKVLTIQAILNSITAVIVYHSIVKNRGSAFSYLLGYGMVCPSLIVVPFHMMRFLGLHNMSMLVGQAASMSVVLFRCLMGTSLRLIIYGLVLLLFHLANPF